MNEEERISKKKGAVISQLVIPKDMILSKPRYPLNTLHFFATLGDFKLWKISESQGSHRWP